MKAPPEPVHLTTWIAENAAAFRPPVANKVVFRDSEFITMVVKGPNCRNDFHINPGDELFHQLRGAIRVDTRGVDGGVSSTIVREGELFLVPAGVPHSPRRPADTWGLVIERQRRVGELDGVAWYCHRCGTTLAEQQFAMSDIETQLAPVLGAFAQNAAAHRCPKCREVLAPAQEIAAV